MASDMTFGASNSGFQGGVINGNVTANFEANQESPNQACLRDLGTTNPRDDKDRIQNASGGLLKDSYQWILENDEFKRWQNLDCQSTGSRLLWISGDPGKGKTMLLCGIIDELTRLTEGAANISFFFCQATDKRINTAVSVLRNLIYLLVVKNSTLLSHVRARYDITKKTLFEDKNAWSALSAIFTDILEDSSLKSTYIVIDALDECTEDLSSLLDLVVQKSAGSARRDIRWIVSSRNWPEIRERLSIASKIVPISLELEDTLVTKAVNTFIEQKVKFLGKVKGYDKTTYEKIRNHLLQNSRGTFLWVALVCQNLEKAPPRHALKKLEAFPPGLDLLYKRMLDQVRQVEDVELCERILAIILTVFRPITLPELRSLLDSPENEYDDQTLSEVIADCGSFLRLGKKTIRLIHQSAKDFLLDEILPDGTEDRHHASFTHSLDILSRALQNVTFGIKEPYDGYLSQDIIRSGKELFAAAKYACHHWVDHLQSYTQNGKKSLKFEEIHRVNMFLRLRYSDWTRASRIIHRDRDNHGMMQTLNRLITCDRPGSLLPTRQNVPRVCNSYIIVQQPNTSLKVHYSPRINSLTSTFGMHFFPFLPFLYHRNETPPSLWRDILEGWNWCLRLRALEGNSGVEVCIGWSSRKNQQAPECPEHGTTDPGLERRTESHAIFKYKYHWATERDTLWLWDPKTGQRLSALEGDGQEVNGIAWSPDETQIASVCLDEVAKFWNHDTGQTVSFHGEYGGWAGSVTWSPDRSRLIHSDNGVISTTLSPISFLYEVS